MSITTNDGGVLKKLGTISTNDGGVIRNMVQINANDGGVLRKVHSAKKVEISGITPLVVADDHIVIVNSGTFTLSLPQGARIIIAGGGQDGQKAPNADSDGMTEDSGFSYGSTINKGGRGGFVAEYTLTSDIKNASCTVTLGEARSYNGGLSASILKIGSDEYNSGSKTQVIQTKWGPIGGNGGNGYYRYSSSKAIPQGGTNATGAGGGGGGLRVYVPLSSLYTDYISEGGNISGYGNKGGNGSVGSYGENGSCGRGGNGFQHIGGGGGGGYGAGGGGSASTSSEYSDDSGTIYDTQSASPGQGGAGIIVIEW